MIRSIGGVFLVRWHMLQAWRPMSGEFFFVFSELGTNLVDDTVQRSRDAGTAVAGQEIARMMFRAHAYFHVRSIFVLEVNRHRDRRNPIEKPP